MKTPAKSILIALLMFLPRIASAQYETVIATSPTLVNIDIPTGKVMQVFNFTSPGTTPGSLSLTKGAVVTGVLSSESSLATGTAAKEIYFVGPATITIAAGSGNKVCLSYRLFDNPTGLGSSLPSNTVVIPANAVGNVNIILESSIDLVTWTAASPGSYGSSTSKRFFRIRAVAQ